MCHCHQQKVTFGKYDSEAREKVALFQKRFLCHFLPRLTRPTIVLKDARVREGQRQQRNGADVIQHDSCYRDDKGGRVPAHRKRDASTRSAVIFFRRPSLGRWAGLRRLLQPACYRAAAPSDLEVSKWTRIIPGGPRKAPQVPMARPTASDCAAPAVDSFRKRRRS